MEANFGRIPHHSYGPVVPNLKALGKRSMEWDLHDWKWDGDLFSATPLHHLPTDCYGKQLFSVGSSFCPEENGNNGLEKRDLEKRRRDNIVVVDEELEKDEVGSLNLKLGGQVYPITETDMEKWEGKSGKKSKVVEVSTSNRAVCQVEDCRADLSCAKDYHRRHKVCEVHSKATRALVANVMQRFCQQCSRFHVLEEFDEGKRSCRRRLAGHNRRRRKTHPENVVNATPLIDEQSSSYLLVSLLRILANKQANSLDQTKDQDFISHLLRNLAAGSNIGGNISAPLDNPQDLHNAGTSNGTSEKKSLKSNLQHITRTMPEKRPRKNDIDLNNAYDDSQDCEEIINNGPAAPPIHGTSSPDYTLWGYKGCQTSNIPQNSGNSGSLSTLSPSSSSGEAQSRTDRIVFKLFGKDPSDFPLALRKQIFDWLSDTPTDIESYIRPGCIILTIYLRLGKSNWEEICYDLRSSLTKLLEASDDSFWKMGWVYTRVLNQIAFIHNGRVVLDTMLPLRSQKSCTILGIKPIAASVSERAQFSVKGINLTQSSTRIHCALKGKYLDQECSGYGEESNMSLGNIKIQCLRFSCSIPNVIGRGFIEVEDESLNSSFFPFIVAEHDVCTEIRTLETMLDATLTPDYRQPLESGLIKAREDALQFVHEMGWLLHRTQSALKLVSVEPNPGPFPFRRFSLLMDYSIDHDWCAVVKNLLGIVFSGIVDAGDYSCIELAMLDMGLVHRAVRRNCKSMVENLLNYVSYRTSDKYEGEKHLFMPDASGPGGLTPLHIAANKEGSEYVLDALTNDPGLVGIKAWKGARDSTGMTPNDYATLRGYYSYINLVEKKIDQMLSSTKGHVVLDIEKPPVPYKSTTFASFDTEKNEIVKQNYQQLNCRLCEQKMAYGNHRTSLSIYRPAMLSMLAIAAVCICAALLFKSSPKVVYVFEPFRWEHLDYGSI